MTNKRSRTRAKPVSKPASGPRVVPFDEADELLDGALSASFQGGYRTVALLPGNVTLKGDLQKAVDRLVTRQPYELIAVEGNLTVDGRIRLYEGLPGLYVGGTTKAETFEGGDCEIYIGDGSFTYFVYGYYNDGTLETGEVKTPWVINSNHDLRVDAPKAKTIDNYGNDDDYDFGSENIASSFVPAVVRDDEIDIERFYKHLKAKRPVLRPGAKTNQELALVEVERAKDRPELVITTTKLKAFPPKALTMKHLAKLVLDGNELGKVPDGIGTLTALEELSLADCSLASLPASIGKLKHLRVLRIGGNKDYKFTARGTKVVPIALPTSIGELSNLEELDVSELSEPGERGALPPMSVFALPVAVAKLKKLRVLRANGTNLAIPKAMWGLPSLEVIEMHGSSWAYLKEFPTWITSFPNLRRLDLSGNFFPRIPDLGKLKHLEELDLGNALGFVKKLPDLSNLPKLRVLDLSGNTSHSDVPEPAHDVLLPLFAMKLPALEDLRIDRWGGDGKPRGPLSPTQLAGIGAFTKLQKLDLEFDGLTRLPAELYKLPGIRELKLAYNRLGKAELAKIKKTWPKATIEVGVQR